MCGKLQIIALGLMNEAGPKFKQEDYYITDPLVQTSVIIIAAFIIASAQNTTRARLKLTAVSKPIDMIQ